MSFADDIDKFTLKLEGQALGVFLGSVDGVNTSVVRGSTVTTAPGQPVGQYGEDYHPGRVGGTLLASWQLRFPDKWKAELTTHLKYAPVIEAGEVEAHVRKEHTRGPYTRKDGTEVKAHTVTTHDVSARELTLRSSVGGFHSVALTRAGWQKIVDQAVKEVTAA